MICIHQVQLLKYLANSSRHVDLDTANGLHNAAALHVTCAAGQLLIKRFVSRWLINQLHDLASCNSTSAPQEHRVMSGVGKSVVATDVLWSDPSAQPGLVENEARGVGLLFGPDITQVPPPPSPCPPQAHCNGTSMDRMVVACDTGRLQHRLLRCWLCQQKYLQAAVEIRLSSLQLSKAEHVLLLVNMPDMLA